MFKLTVKYSLSSEGQKKALREGKPAQKIQTVELEAPESALDIPGVKIDSEGNASICYISYDNCSGADDFICRQLCRVDTLIESYSGFMDRVDLGVSKFKAHKEKLESEEMERKERAEKERLKLIETYTPLAKAYLEGSEIDFKVLNNYSQSGQLIRVCSLAVGQKFYACERVHGTRVNLPDIQLFHDLGEAMLIRDKEYLAREKKAEEEKESRKKAQLDEAVEKYGSELLKERWKEGVAKVSEAIDLIEEQALKNVSDFNPRPYVNKFSPEGFEREEASKKETLTDEQFTKAKGIRKMLPEDAKISYHKYTAEQEESEYDPYDDEEEQKWHATVMRATWNVGEIEIDVGFVLSECTK